MDDTVPATANVAGELDIAACEEYFQGRALKIFVKRSPVSVAGGFNLKPVVDPCRSIAYANYKHHIPNHTAATFASELGRKVTLNVTWLLVPDRML